MAQRVSALERVRIEEMRAAGVSVEEIARRLERHRSTVCRELRRGVGDRRGRFRRELHRDLGGRFVDVHVRVARRRRGGVLGLQRGRSDRRAGRRGQRKLLRFESSVRSAHQPRHPARRLRWR